MRVCLPRELSAWGKHSKHLNRRIKKTEEKFTIPKIYSTDGKRYASEFPTFL